MCTTESTVDTALRPKSPSLSQASVNTMRFVSSLLQATDSGEGEPAIQIKWLDSSECYMLSTWWMPPWLVLISEYKSVGNSEDPLVYTLVQNNVTTGLYDMLYVLLFFRHWWIFNLFIQNTHVGFSLKRAIGILFSYARKSLNDLTNTTQPQFVHFTIFLYHSSPTVRPKAPRGCFPPWMLNAWCESQDECDLYAT